MLLKVHDEQNTYRGFPAGVKVFSGEGKYRWETGRSQLLKRSGHLLAAGLLGEFRRPVALLQVHFHVCMYWQAYQFPARKAPWRIILR